ncbi:MAG: glycoside hydrolase family 30 beta sandwich domain-containing protein [Chryseolinea sp.]
MTPYYYLIKHFSKHVDAGYHRVASSSSNASLYTSAFISTDNKQITVVAINNGTETAKVYFDAAGKTITSMSADQSKTDSYYKALQTPTPKKSISLPAKSITTIVLSI